MSKSSVLPSSCSCKRAASAPLNTPVPAVRCFLWATISCRCRSSWHSPNNCFLFSCWGSIPDTCLCSSCICPPQCQYNTIPPSQVRATYREPHNVVIHLLVLDQRQSGQHPNLQLVGQVGALFRVNLQYCTHNKYCRWLEWCCRKLYESTAPTWRQTRLARRGMAWSKWGCRIISQGTSWHQKIAKGFGD